MNLRETLQFRSPLLSSEVPTCRIEDDHSSFSSFLLHRISPSIHCLCIFFQPHLHSPGTHFFNHFFFLNSEFAYSLSRFVETKDVLRVVSAKQKWDSNDVRVANLDVAKVRFGTSRSYEFRIGLGTGNFTLKFADQVATWNKFRTPFPDLPSLVHRLSSFPVLPTLKLEGPFSLRVDALHHLSLSLPVSNFFFLIQFRSQYATP